MADQPRFRRLRRFSFGSDLRRAIDDEIASHLEHAVRELVADGMDPVRPRTKPCAASVRWRRTGRPACPSTADSAGPGGGGRSCATSSRI